MIAYREFSVIKMANITVSKMVKNDVSSLAKIDEKTVGYIGYMVIIGEADIINIGVLPEYRGLGIGNMLMDAMIDELKKNGATRVHLEVRKSNVAAISLYKKYGFIATGVSKNHYKEPTEDAIRMNLCL